MEHFINLAVPGGASKLHTELRVADLESYLQCPRRLWLEWHGADLSPPAPPTKLDFKRHWDTDAVRMAFREHVEQQFPQREKHFFSRSTKDDDTESHPKTFDLRFTIGKFVAEPHALVKCDYGWLLLSARASTTDPAKPSADSDHLFAAAAQAWVFQQATGVSSCRIHVAYLNKKFEIHAADPVSQSLFIEVDVTADCQEHLSQISQNFDAWLAGAQEALASSAAPVVSIGAHCKKGGDCVFLDFCKDAAPNKELHPIELLPGSPGKTLAKKLRQNGVTSLLDASDEDLTVKNPESRRLYQKIRDAHITGVPALSPRAAETLYDIPYPRYFFDFEGIDLAVPIWPGITPYTQVPFQWSCHVELTPEVFEHHEFLDLTGEDPSLRCIEAMLEAMPATGSEKIFVYHATYEKGRMEELADRYPQHRAALLSYCNRLFDLLPLVKDCYYHPDMKGSFSIKKVLPTIAPHLDYANLTGVQDGTAAQISYLRAIIARDSHSSRESKTALLAYCRQDTWAMVAVAYHLSGLLIPKDEAPTRVSRIF